VSQVTITRYLAFLIPTKARLVNILFFGYVPVVIERQAPLALTLVLTDHSRIGVERVCEAKGLRRLDRFNGFIEGTEVQLANRVTSTALHRQPRLPLSSSEFGFALEPYATRSTMSSRSGHEHALALLG